MTLLTKKERIRLALIAYRLAMGWSMRRMAEALGISQANVSRIESGNVKVSDEKLDLYLNRLGLASLEALLTYAPTPQQQAIVEQRMGTPEATPQQNTQIVMMQHRVEQFIGLQFLAILAAVQGRQEPEFSKTDKGHAGAVQEAFEELWNLQGMHLLLDGVCTAPDFDFLKRYQRYQLQQHQSELDKELGRFQKTETIQSKP